MIDPVGRIKIIHKPAKNFVGIDFEKNGQILLSVPNDYVMSNDDPNFFADIKYFLKALHKARTRRSELRKIEGVEGEFINDFPLSSMVWILGHYKTYGRPLTYEKRYSVNTSGRINWKRTLHGETFIIGNDVYFKNAIYENKCISNSLIIDAYYYCVYEAVSKVGIWLEGMNPKSVPWEKKIITPYLKSKYLNCIKKELDSTFNDDNRLLLTHMKNIVCETIGKDGVISSFGVSSFDVVFESIVDSILGNVVNKTIYEPSASYLIGGKASPLKNKLIPDTIHIANNKVYVIDSKCYAKGSLPEISSIQKQITYAENIDFNHDRLSAPPFLYDRDEIYNCFIFPASLPKDQLFSYYGDATSSWKSSQKKYETIKCFYIDLKKAVREYNCPKSFDWLKKFYSLFSYS
ncbi:MAG: LlaJI family restriction endonuclease [Bacilli bacterium]|nr:LlaJI family restriction endonuclease [Bacilli bacterium]